jgi:hypothetical protein
MSICTTDTVDGFDPEHSAFSYSSKEGLKAYEGFSQKRVEESSDISYNTILYDQLSTVVSWHDQIANLPLMDKNWTYQIEFGLDPLYLYQVRPFKKIERADFELPQTKDYYKPLIFGVTPKTGINVRAETRVWDRHCEEKIINPENHPSLFYDSLRKARIQEYLSNTKVNILESAIGILAHDDIRSIRRVDVTALYPTGPYITIEQGQWYNIKSDGKSIKITKIR